MAPLYMWFKSALKGVVKGIIISVSFVFHQLFSFVKILKENFTISQLLLVSYSIRATNVKEGLAG